MAVARVAQRVREGGHHIPEDVIRRRYETGLRNMLHLYLSSVDTAFVINNIDESGMLIAERRQDGPLVVHDVVRWQLIEEATR